MAIRIKLPYETGPGGRKRPYLTLVLAGPSTTVLVRGLLDSGADVSVLPSIFIPHLGLGPEELEEVPIATSSGSGTAVHATRPLWAFIPGYDARRVPLRPLFLEEVGEASWGRDFMSVYSVAFAEQDQQFSLYADDG